MDAEEVRRRLKSVDRLLEERSFKEAEEEARLLVQDVEQAQGPDSSLLVRPIQALVYACKRQRAWNDPLRPEERRLLERALAIASGTYGDDGPRTRGVRAQLAASLAASGEDEEAAVHYAMLSERILRSESAPRIEETLYLSGLASALEGAGRLAEAEELLKTMHERYFDLMRPFDAVRLDFSRSRVVFGLGRPKEALEFVDRAIEATKKHARNPENRLLDELNEFRRRVVEKIDQS